MDYSLLDATELEEMFYRTKNPFRLDAWDVLGMPTEPQKLLVENIRTGLEQLTPNIVEWAFGYNDWRPAQSMATFIACGKLSQYEHLLNKQLQTCYFCGPYIFVLVRIATPDTTPILKITLLRR